MPKMRYYFLFWKKLQNVTTFLLLPRFCVYFSLYSSIFLVSGDAKMFLSWAQDTLAVR